MAVHQNHMRSYLEIKLPGPNLTASLLCKILWFSAHLEWESVSLPWPTRPTGSHSVCKLLSTFLPKVCMTVSCHLGLNLNIVFSENLPSSSSLTSPSVLHTCSLSLACITLFFFIHSSLLSLKWYLSLFTCLLSISGAALSCHLFLYGLRAKNSFCIFEINEKNHTSLYVKITWHSNFSVCKWSAVGPQPCPFISRGSLAAFLLKGTTGWLWQRLYGPQSLKYLLSGHLQKKFADLWSSTLTRM